MEQTEDNLMTKVPDPNDLVGITVNDEPLTVAVKKLEHNEVAAVVKEELYEQRRCLPASAFASIAAAALRAQAKYYVPHSRTKHLTKDQIRKEYGVMSAPHPTMLANVLDCIRLSERPLSNKEIAAATRYSVEKVTQTTSNVFQFKELLGGMDTTTDSAQKVKLYKIDPKHWPNIEGLLACYNKVLREHKKRTKSKLFSTSDSGTQSAEPKETKTPDAFSKLAECARQELEKSLGISVTISGRIEVVFKFDSQEG